MNIDTTSSMAAPTLAQEAGAALLAITDQAQAANLAAVAELAEVASEAQIAEHIRGMVAATMGHLSSDASANTRIDAQRWQEWALGVADGVERRLSAAVQVGLVGR